MCPNIIGHFHAGEDAVTAFARVFKNLGLALSSPTWKYSHWHCATHVLALVGSYELSHLGFIKFYSY